MIENPDPGLSPKAIPEEELAPQLPAKGFHSRQADAAAVAFSVLRAGPFQVDSPLRSAGKQGLALRGQEDFGRSDLHRRAAEIFTEAPRAAGHQR